MILSQDMNEVKSTGFSFCHSTEWTRVSKHTQKQRGRHHHLPSFMLKLKLKVNWVSEGALLWFMNCSSTILYKTWYDH